jgi:hypothetical protein
LPFVWAKKPIKSRGRAYEFPPPPARGGGGGGARGPREGGPTRLTELAGLSSS